MNQFKTPSIVKKYIFNSFAAALTIYACNGSPAEHGIQETAATSVHQMIASEYCACLEETKWGAINKSNLNDPGSEAAMLNIVRCSQGIGQQHGIPTIWINNDDSDSLRLAILATCPKVIKKCDELTQLFSKE